MSERQSRILDALEGNPVYGLTISEISAYIGGAPAASIRRDIQALRRLRYNISFASPNGVYRLGPSL